MYQPLVPCIWVLLIGSNPETKAKEELLKIIVHLAVNILKILIFLILLHFSTQKEFLILNLKFLSFLLSWHRPEQLLNLILIL